MGPGGSLGSSCSILFCGSCLFDFKHCHDLAVLTEVRLFLLPQFSNQREGDDRRHGEYHKVAEDLKRSSKPAPALCKIHSKVTDR